MRRRPWFPLLALLGQLVVVGATAVAVDGSGLDRAPGSWPFVVGFALLLVYAAPWPVGATLLTGLVGAVARDPGVRRGAAMFGAVVSASWGGSGLLLGVAWLVMQPDDATRVVALATVAGGTLTLLPLRPAFGADPARRDG